MHSSLAATQYEVHQRMNLLEQEIMATREALQQRLAELEGRQAESRQNMQGERITLNTLTVNDRV
jgi:glutathione S-transferase